MPSLSSLQSGTGRAIGQLHAGVHQNVVVARFGVSQAAISELQRYQRSARQPSQATLRDCHKKLKSATFGTDPPCT